MRLLVIVCVFQVAAAAAAQTMVESALITGAASTAAGAKGKGIGASIGNVFNKAGATAATAAGESTRGSRPAASRTVSGAATPVTRAAAEPPPPKPSRSAFEGIEKGMPREQLLAKAGKPSFSLSMTEEGRLVETLRYNTREGSSAKIRLTDGIVSSVEWIEPD